MKVDEQLESLVNAVLGSQKYRNICSDLVRNIGRRELSKRRSVKEAVKATKSKLHQIGEAYFLAKPRYDVWLQKLRDAKETGHEEFKNVCMEIMALHYSTKERLWFLDDFYQRVFSLLPPVHSIMDIGCGFHPLAIPWMPLSGKVKYYAYDIYEDLTDFLNGYMSFLADVEGYAEPRDVIQHPPTLEADLAFILEAVPCFEQVEKAAGLKLLESTDADFLVVSFPVRSLGGRDKGMQEFYEARFESLTREKDWTMRRLEFFSEMVFLLNKKQQKEPYSQIGRKR